MGLTPPRKTRRARRGHSLCSDGALAFVDVFLPCAESMQKRLRYEMFAPSIDRGREFEYEDVTAQALRLGHTPDTWKAVPVPGYCYDPYRRAFLKAKGVYKTAILPPPVVESVVQASTKRASCEVPALTPSGTLVPGSPADLVLRQWAAPMAVGRGAAPTPLVVVGHTVFWASINQIYALKLRSFPRVVETTRDMLCDGELPTATDALKRELFMDKTKDAHVVFVYFSNVRSMALFVANRLAQVQTTCPTKSFVLFAPDMAPQAASDDALPPAIRERCTVLTWRSTHPAAASEAALPAAANAGSPLHTVAASHLRAGGALHPGRGPSQQLGLEPASQRDLAWYYNNQQAEAMARHTSAIAGRLAKRFKPSDAFVNPARAMDLQLQGFATDFGRFTNA